MTAVIFTSLFSLSWVAVIYILNNLLARKILSIEWGKLFIFILTMTALGIFGEFALDWIYKLAFSRPLWVYEIMPIHGGFTSLYSLFLWGTIGIHLYFLHPTLAKWKIHSTNQLAFIFCIDAILLEALVNLSHLALFGSYIYYYLPSNLWHITAIQTLPLYLFAGYIATVALRYANRLPRLALTGNTVVLLTLIMVK